MKTITIERRKTDFDLVFFNSSSRNYKSSIIDENILKSIVNGSLKFQKNIEITILDLPDDTMVWMNKKFTHKKSTKKVLINKILIND